MTTTFRYGVLRASALAAALLFDSACAFSHLLPARQIARGIVPRNGIGAKPALTTASVLLHAADSTSMRPLYDGTNYTFPDTSSPDGIAELLEVSFVNACLQLRTGLVDVLKLFIAAAVSGYETGYDVSRLIESLENCETQSAGRPLSPEEVDLRRVWINLIYLMLASIDHPSKNSMAVSAQFVADDVRQTYASGVEKITQNHKNGRVSLVEQIMSEDPSDLTVVERAIKAQSLRVAVLTLVVLQDSENSEIKPPNPPIEGAF